MNFEVVRLEPGDDLRLSLEELCRDEKMTAGFIASAVGSLTGAELRFAGVDDAAFIEGPLEIVSLSGTLSVDGAHLHASVSDSEGKVTGGHVLAGCIVRTTCEVVIGVMEGWEFRRVKDKRTGYKELVARKK